MRGEYNRVAEMSASVGVCIAAVEDLSSAVAGAIMRRSGGRRWSSSRTRYTWTGSGTRTRNTVQFSLRSLLLGQEPRFGRDLDVEGEDHCGAYHHLIGDGADAVARYGFCTYRNAMSASSEPSADDCPKTTPFTLCCESAPILSKREIIH